jgi:hypothetical protein
LPPAFRTSPFSIFKHMMLSFLLASFTLHAQAQACVSSAALLSTQQPVALYVWSPRMVQSVLQAPSAKRAAEQSGAHFIAALDPRVPQLEAQAALNAASAEISAALTASKPLCTDAFEHALDHAPTLFVSAQQRLHVHRIIGVMPQHEWRAAISLRLHELASH